MEDSKDEATGVGAVGSLEVRQTQWQLTVVANVTGTGQNQQKQIVQSLIPAPSSWSRPRSLSGSSGRETVPR
eukprot:4511801-Pyramimonas_sp.AAC.1